MSESTRRLKEVLDAGGFAVTVEYNPPKGTNIAGLLANARTLVGRVHAVNVTDNTAAVMRASSLSICRLLYEMGHDPVMQMTCRDRNRLGIQSDLLGAHLLGIRNVLCLTGDYATNKLDGSTEFVVGGAVTPEADPLGPMLAKFETKVRAGAQFFQTQAVYHPKQFETFMAAVRPLKVKVLVGILVLRTARMAEFM